LIDFALPHRVLLVRREWHASISSWIFEIRDGERPKQIEEGWGGAKSSNDPIIFPLTKSRLMTNGRILLKRDAGTRGPLDSPVERRFLSMLIDATSDCDGIIVSDYGYGILTPLVLQALGAVQARRRRVLVVDSRHNLRAFKSIGVTAVKPNYLEAIRLLGLRETPPGSKRATTLATYGERLLDLTGASLAAVTLDQEGTMLFQRNRPAYRMYGLPRRKTVAIGAGDTFVSALALGLAAEASAEQAAEVATAAATLGIRTNGTAVCTATELYSRATRRVKSREWDQRPAAPQRFSLVDKGRFNAKTTEKKVGHGV
jgi:D-beta-D-heptose 7-phosphate kinase/D-beta-D-heptose 1-phosphate adenosyltransferase